MNGIVFEVSALGSEEEIGFDLACSEIVIMGQDDRPLYNLELSSKGDLIVSTYMPTKYKDVLLDEEMSIAMRQENMVSISRKEYDSGTFSNQNRTVNPVSFMIKTSRDDTGDKGNHVVSGLTIYAQDDNPLFDIQLDFNGSLIIATTKKARFDGVELLPAMSLIPRTAHHVSVSRVDA